jgi:hypothetical protein
MFLDRHGALMSFWVIGTLVHMCHRTQVRLVQRGTSLCFWVVRTLVLIDLESLVHLFQCGALVCFDQSGAPMSFWHVVAPMCL